MDDELLKCPERTPVPARISIVTCSECDAIYNMADLPELTTLPCGHQSRLLISSGKHINECADALHYCHERHIDFQILEGEEC